MAKPVAEPVPEPVAETESKVEPDPVADKKTIEQKFQEADTNGDGVIDAKEFEALMKSNDDEEEEEMEVDQREFDGITYYVNESNGNIYHLDCEEDDEHYGEVIGTWTEDGPNINEEWKNRIH